MKHTLRALDAAATARIKVLTKKPLVPGDDEVQPQPAGAQREAARRGKDGLTWNRSSTPSRKTSATTRSSARWTRRGSASCGNRSAIAGFLVLVLLFSAWQHFELLRHGYQIEEMQRERAAEEETGRQLRLEIDTLRSPKRIEALATEPLHLVAPSARRRDRDRARRAGRSAGEVRGCARR